MILINNVSNSSLNEVLARNVLGSQEFLPPLLAHGQILLSPVGTGNCIVTPLIRAEQFTNQVWAGFSESEKEVFKTELGWVFNKMRQKRVVYANPTRECIKWCNLEKRIAVLGWGEWWVETEGKRMVDPEQWEVKAVLSGLE